LSDRDDAKGLEKVDSEDDAEEEQDFA